MARSNARLSRRLSLSSERTEQVYSVISEIDAAGAVFRLTDRLTPETLGQLTQSVIGTSSGASTRIEGARLTDQEVEVLYCNMSVRKLRTRDEQKVAGYLEVLARVLEGFADTPLRESLILQLHRDMLRHSDKDERQRGPYKFGPNRRRGKGCRRARRRLYLRSHPDAPDAQGDVGTCRLAYMGRRK